MNTTQAREHEEQARGCPPRRLVTFALFAYNQERYVRSAIEGAFAQTYEPLEIILSDDCSTDRTFEIMKEMAASYQGPHTILVNRPESNLGVFRHSLDVFHRSKGDFIVVSAGDDISMPNRVAIAVEAWKSTGAYIICSSYDEIDENGAILNRNLSPKTLSNGMEKYFFSEPDFPVSSIHGASACYDRKVFEHLIDPEDRISFEDMITSFVINKLRQPVGYIDDSLLRYRRHAQAIVNRPEQWLLPQAETEASQFRIHQSHFNMFAYLRRLDDHMEQRMPGILRPLNHEVLERDACTTEDFILWSEMSLGERLKGILFHTKSLGEFKWKLLRLWGANPRYFPSMVLKDTWWALQRTFLPEKS